MLRSKDPEGIAQEMWALFAVYQAVCQLIGAGTPPASPGPDQLPACPGRRDRHGRGFSPDQLDRALATFLLMILQPRLFVRDRPGRASPRKTKKAGDFPARKPGGSAGTGSRNSGQ